LGCKNSLSNQYVKIFFKLSALFLLPYPLYLPPSPDY